LLCQRTDLFPFFQGYHRQKPKEWFQTITQDRAIPVRQNNEMKSFRKLSKDTQKMQEVVFL